SLPMTVSREISSRQRHAPVLCPKSGRHVFPLERGASHLFQNRPRRFPQRSTEPHRVSNNRSRPESSFPPRMLHGKSCERSRKADLSRQDQSLAVLATLLGNRVDRLLFPRARSRFHPRTPFMPYRSFGD